jgi:hypothetical protein
MLYDFKSGLKAAASAHRINNAFGANTVSDGVMRKCFAHLPTTTIFKINFDQVVAMTEGARLQC